MKLARNWVTVAKRSWSFWGNILLALAMAVAGGFAYDGTFYWAMFAAQLVVAVLRLLHQGGFGNAD